MYASIIDYVGLFYIVDLPSHLSQLSDFNLSNASPSKIGESVFVVFFMLEIQLINDTTSLIIAF